MMTLLVPAALIAVLVIAIGAIAGGLFSRSAGPHAGKVVLVCAMICGIGAALIATLGVARYSLRTVSISNTVPAVRVPVVSIERQQVLATETAAAPATPSVPVPPMLTIAVPSATLPATSAPSKQWVSDWPGFVSASNWNGFRAYSTDTCPSEAEARQEALKAAATDLAAVLSARPEVQATGKQGIYEHVLAALQAGHAIADQEEVRIEKPYGTLWKYYLLIDASPQSVEPIIASFSSAVAIDHARQMDNWKAIGLLGVVIVLAYGFLNAATKGYFMWRLRAVALLALIVAILACVSMV